MENLKDTSYPLSGCSYFLNLFKNLTSTIVSMVTYIPLIVKHLRTSSVSRSVSSILLRLLQGQDRLCACIYRISLCAYVSIVFVLYFEEKLLRAYSLFSSYDSPAGSTGLRQHARVSQGVSVQLDFGQAIRSAWRHQLIVR